MKMSTNLTIRDQSENPSSENHTTKKNYFLSDTNKAELKNCICMLLAELVGTFCLLFFGCMGCIDWIQMPGEIDSCFQKLKKK